jgi:hypothetical protein
LIGAANKALVELGAGAEKIPEIMGLARKATAVFGGELVQNFENINMAISTGNVRLLKHLGLNVDVEKAVRKFAEAHNIAANALSEAGKQQAIMNAVLETGAKRFDGVDVTALKATNAWIKFKTSLAAIGEEIAVVFSKMFGGTISSSIDHLSTTIDQLTAKMKANFSTGKEASEGRIKDLEIEIDREKKRLEFVEKHGNQNFIDVEGTKKRVEGLSAELAKLEQIEEKKEQHRNAATASSKEGVPGPSLEDQAKALEDKAKFEEEKLKIDEDMNKRRIEMADTEEQLNAARQEREDLLYQEYAVKFDQLQANKDITEQQRDLLQESAYNDYLNKLAEADEKHIAERQHMYDEAAKHQQNQWSGISAGYKANLNKDKVEVESFSKTGERAYQSLKGGALSAFEAVGKGQKSVGDAMLAVTAEVAANEARVRGQVFFLEGIAEFNPIKIAAGAGLMALAGALGGLGGGTGASAPVASAPASAGGTGEFNAPDISQGPTESQVQPRKTVNINIDGNLYETETTRQHLAQLVRDNLDATDFNISRLGQS